MAILITIFKTELEKHLELSDHLKLLSQEIKEVGPAYIYIPKGGHLMQAIKLLGTYGVVYGIHGDTNEEGAKP
jgi:hypothetical protein